MESSDVDFINIQIKTPKGASFVKMSKTASVAQLRQTLATQFNCSPAQCCIISHGKIMKDPDSLNYYGIKENSVVHLIIKSTEKKKPTYDANSSAQPTTTTTSQSAETQNSNPSQHENKPSSSSEPRPSSEPKPSQGAFKLPPLNMESLMGEGAANPFMSMNNIQNILGDPNLNKPLMEMTTKFLDNLSPAYFNNLLSSHPQLSKFLETHPEFRSQFTPSNLKKMMEIFSNPVMAEEFMRNQNQAIQAIQNLPDGARQLEKIMKQLSDIEQPGANAYEYRPTQNESSKNSTDHGPNLSSVPIPNPWENEPPATPEQSSFMNFPSMAARTPGQKNEHMNKLFEMAMNSNLGNMFGGNDGTSQPPPLAALNSNNSSKSADDQTANNSNGFESLMNSISSNLNNFNFAGGSNNNAGTPPIDADLIKNFMTPENMQAFMNPKVSDALMKIQHYFNVIKQEAPALFENMFNPANFNLGAFPPTDPSASFRNMLFPSTPPASNSTGGFASTSPFVGMPSTQPDSGDKSPANLREKFSAQLEQMKIMGFADETKCLRALEISNGDINLAIEWLINNNLF